MDYKELFFNTTKELICAIDLNYRFLFFSASYKEVFEKSYCTNIFIGENLLEAINKFPEEQKRLKNIWDKALRGDSFTEILRLGNEGCEYYEIRFTPLKDKQGNLIGSSHISMLITEIEQTNRELNFAESKIMQSVINNTQDKIVAVDKEHRFLAFNKAYLLGFQNYGLEVRIGEPVKSVVKSEDLYQKVTTWWDRALSGESFTTVEQFEGGAFYSLRFCPLYNDDEELIGASHIATDITERMNMQNTIEQLNEQLNQKLKLANETVSKSKQNISKLQEKVEFVLDAAGIGAWTWNVKQDIVRSDDKHRNLYQLPFSENMKAEDIFSRIHPEDRGRVRQDLEACISEKSHLMNSEFRIILPNENIRWIASRGKMYLDERGEPEEIVVLNWDISARLRLQEERLEALRAQQEKKEYFEKLAESADLLVWITNSQGKIEYCNRKWKEYTGMNEQDWEWDNILHKDDIEKRTNAWNEALKTGMKFEHECRLLYNSNSQYRWHISKVSPLYNSDGKVIKWFGTATDIHDLKTTQESLNLILKAAKVGLWNYNVIDGKTCLDDSVMDLFGMKENSSTLSEVLEKVHPEDQSLVMEAIRKCISKEAPYELEYRIATDDGSIKYVGARGEAQFDSEGNPLRMMGICFDATNRKLFEKNHLETVKKEREHKELLNLLVENLSVGIWTADAEGNVDFINKFWTSRTGISAPIPKGEGHQIFSSIIHPEYFKDHKKRWDQAAITGTQYEMEYPVKVDGKYRWFLSNAFPLVGEDGSIVRWLGTCIDIHDMKETIKELEFQINLTKTITDNTASALFMIDEKGYPTFMNPVAERITGYTLDEIKSMPLTKSMRPEGTESTCISGPTYEVQNQQETFVDKNGRIYPVTVSTSRLIRNGATIGAVVEFRDITLEKQAEQERIEALRQAESLQKKRAEEAENNKKRQEEFINTICHEVRNPLNGLIGITSLLSDELKDIQGLISRVCESLDDYSINRITSFFIRMGEYIRTLEVCSEQQKIIVDDVLDLSKLENNKISLNLSPVNIKSLINTTLQMFLGRLTEKHLKYKVNIASSDIWIQGDAYRLSQILINLLSNAIKFTELGGITIDVSVVEKSTGGLTLSIAVIDTGIGMAPNEVINLFSSFYQANTKNSYRGTGLGLVITKKLVELMGGKIEVTSEKWKGSTFTLILDCMKAKGKERFDEGNLPKEEINISHSHGTLILIVEDNVINQKVLSNYLEKRGYNYHIAVNGLQAIEKCKIYNFNVILMDIEMPLMNGLEATTKIRKDPINYNNKAPIIGLSGNSMKQQIDEAISAGMNDYLTKPYHKEDVYKVIEKYISAVNFNDVILN